MKRFSVFIVLILIVSMLASCQALHGIVNTDNSEEQEGDLHENMQGFWFLTGMNGEISEDVKRRGIALQIEGTLLNTFTGFEAEKQHTYLNISDSDKFIYDIGRSQGEADIIFDKRDGYKLMILEDDGENLIFEKTEIEIYDLYKGMTEAVPELEKGGKTIYLDDSLSDSELRFYIEDMYWFELYFMCSDGSTSEMLENTFILYSDGTGIDEYEDSIDDVTWTVENGYLYIYYSDGTSFYSPVDYAYDAATGYVYLYLYDLNEGYEDCAWIYYNYIE